MSSSCRKYFKAALSTGLAGSPRCLFMYSTMPASRYTLIPVNLSHNLPHWYDLCGWLGVKNWSSIYLSNPHFRQLQTIPQAASEREYQINVDLHQFYISHYPSIALDWHPCENECRVQANFSIWLSDNHNWSSVNPFSTSCKRSVMLLRWMQDKNSLDRRTLQKWKHTNSPAWRFQVLPIIYLQRYRCIIL